MDMNNSAVCCNLTCPERNKCFMARIFKHDGIVSCNDWDVRPLEDFWYWGYNHGCEGLTKDYTALTNFKQDTKIWLTYLDGYWAATKADL
jgi:hypothetical protein